MKFGGLSGIVIAWKEVREQERWAYAEHCVQRERLLGYIWRFCDEKDMTLSAHGAADWTELFARF